MSGEITFEEFEEAWKELRVRRARRDFLKHLAAYIIVNAFLIFVNLWTSAETIWFVWVMAGWGIGLAFHYIESRPASVIEETEKEIAEVEYLAKRRRSSRGKPDQPSSS